MSSDSAPVLDLEKRVDAAIRCSRGNCIRITITEAELKSLHNSSPLVDRLNRDGFYAITCHEITKGCNSLILKRELPMPISNRVLECCPFLFKLLML